MLREFIWYCGMYCLKYAFALFGVFLYIWKSVLSMILNAMYEKKKERKKMVIIGGGFAGCYSAKKLENHFDITFIDDKDYFEFTPSVPRCLVSPNHINDIQIKHSNYLDLTKTVILRDKVTQLDKNSVYTKSGSKAEYDYLLICTGSTYNKPFKSDNVYKVVRGESFAKKHKEFVNSNKILIIGGGIVGVETAAELLEEFPSKQVTLVHSGSFLMNRTAGMSKKIAQYCEDFLVKRGAKVFLNTKVEVNKSTNTFQSTEGEEFGGDIVLLCTGIVPNSKFLEGTIYGSSRNEQGFLKVTENLNLENFPNVFVCGDVAAVNEEKLAQNAEKSASIVVHNCLMSIKNKTNNYKRYQTVNRPIVISLGKFSALFLWGNWYLTGLFPAWMKVVIEYKVMTQYQFRTGFNFSF